MAAMIKPMDCPACHAAMVTETGSLLSQYFNSDLFALLGGGAIVAILVMTRLFGRVSESTRRR